MGWRVPRSRGPWCRTDGEWIPARNQALFYDRRDRGPVQRSGYESPTGAMIAVSKPVNDPSDQQIVIVRLKRALPPGTYTVSWQAVSIHERPTSGTFRFTVV
jgi:CopC domain